jgi:hypothetical protein
MTYICNRNWVDTRWQQYSTHLHTNNPQNTESRTCIHNKKLNIHNNKKKKNGKCWPCPVFASYTLAFAFELRKKQGKTSVRVAAHTSQADTVQYKYNEQYNTQKENSNTEDYYVTKQYRTQNTQQRRTSHSNESL